MNSISSVCRIHPVRFLQRLKVIAWLAVLMFQSIAVCASDNGHKGLDEELDVLLKSLVDAPGSALQSAILRLHAPQSGFVYQGAAGQRNAEGGPAAGADDRFYIASITKTMTAVRTLQLAESGLFELDTRIAELDVFEPEVINALHQSAGKSLGSAITIRHLLSHRSGMKDYLLDDRTGISSEFESGLAPGSLAAIWMSQWAEFLECSSTITGCSEQQKGNLYPARPWLPWDAAAFTSNHLNRNAGLLNFYLAEMADSALFQPGTGSHYSDTNFLLLGIIIEQLTGSSLQQQFEEGIFAPLAMRDSYLPCSTVGAGEAECARGNRPVSDFRIGDKFFPASGIDTSWDWGGGGVISSAGDLAVFLQALVEGRLFRDPETLKQMLDFYPIKTDGDVMQVGYGLGVRYAQSEYGPRWGHGGAWGAKMEYFPEMGLFITGTVNAYGVEQAEVLLNESVRIFKQHQAELPQIAPHGD